MARYLPEAMHADAAWSTEPPDPLDRPAFYDGVLWRRSLAFFIDANLLFGLVVVLVAFNLVTLFVFAGVLALVIALPVFLIYDTATVGSHRSGTLGMRWMGLEVRTWDGAKPTYPQAFVASALFWFLSPLTSWLILLWGLFDDRRRLLHDLLSGTVVINARRARKADKRPAIANARR